MNRQLRYLSTWRLLGFTWLFVISLLSVAPIAQPLAFDNADKWTHWATWMLMMIWFGAAWPSALKRCLIILLAVSAALELLQGLLPWRLMEMNDLLANLAGLLSGAALLFTPAGLVIPWLDRIITQRFNAPRV